MERLELSKQKLLGPKSSASTNFATSAQFFINKFLNLGSRLKNLFIYVYTVYKTCRFSL